MGKKKLKLISGVVAAALTVTAAFSGCSLISTDNAADMKRTIAEVNISKTEAFQNEFKENSKYFDSIGTTEVIKRELITYFVNVGYTYVQNYGMSYEETFNTLVDGLVSNAILTQYATMYLLQKKTEEDAGALEKFKALSGADHEEYEKYEYLLGEDSDTVKLAKYSLMASVNSAIDASETAIIKADSSSAGSETRSTPGNVGTEQDDYYPAATVNDKQVLDYNIYTGYPKYSLDESGTYKDGRDETLKKGTTATRRRAYTKFISSLISYNLVDTSKEDLRDVLSLKYISGEYVNQLKSQVINEYYDLYEEEQIEKLTGDTTYLDKVYNELYNLQSRSYKTESAFSSAIGEMSDTQFILYAPETEEGGTFGFVYNILLPFSTSQSVKLTALQTQYKDEEVDSGYSSKYYENRNKLLNDIRTTDQRKAWFNGSTEYAFDATGKVDGYYGASNWLFFEDNLTNTQRYKPLDKYIGRYSYNGTAVKKSDGKYVFGNPVELSVDDMLKEFTGYVDYVLNGFTKDGASHVTFDSNYDAANWQPNGYYGTTDFYKPDKNDDKQNQIDYSKLVYASGKVNIDVDRAGVFDKETSQYKAMAAVNELQYAYTTDTSVLSQYLGYSVDAGDTSYIKEFEHAAHEAVNKGAGSFTVCAGDYGWHLIYVTYTFDIARDNDNNQLGGAVYTPNWDNITKEGTFENLFYEWIKTNDIEDISTTRRTQIVNKYNIDKTTVKKYEKAYRNLLNLG